MNREMVLYYTPAVTPNVAKLKGVLVRMGVRIKNISAEQTGQTIGYLAGLPGFEATACAGQPAESQTAESQTAGSQTAGAQTAESQLAESRPAGSPLTESQTAGSPPIARSLSAPPIPCEVLVMHNFTSRRIDELLLNLRKAGVPRIALKAVVTEHNSHWTFYHLYEEIKKEHEAMTPPSGCAERG